MGAQAANLQCICSRSAMDDRQWQFRSWLSLVVLALLQLQPAFADNLDIQVKLFQDPNCFERAQDATMLDNGCYANLYSNLSKAFTVKATGFPSSSGSTEARTIEL